MRTLTQHARRLPILLLAIITLMLTALPVPKAGATPAADWAAWAITADFKGGALQVVYTVYTGTQAPNAQVLASSSQDITASCTVSGLTFSGEYGVFNGSTMIACPVPSWRDAVFALDPSLGQGHKNKVTEIPGTGPLWAAADVILDPGTSDNPVVDASDLGMVFSLPRSGATARTRLTLSSGSYVSPNWNADNLAGNRTLIGADGPVIVAIDKEFGWLDFLKAPDWSNYFNGVNGMQVGYRTEGTNVWQGVQSAAAPYTLKTTAGTVNIGYNSKTGTYFRGRIRSIRFDPGSKGN
ncbi:MAG TPA: hypothetical protein VFO07_06700 [Roseiflexaceae bacterium]|nr:hypothetical protein [Roseiflexaceae bacterium]